MGFVLWSWEVELGVIRGGGWSFGVRRYVGVECVYVYVCVRMCLDRRRVGGCLGFKFIGWDLSEGRDWRFLGRRW